MKNEKPELLVRLAEIQARNSSDYDKCCQAFETVASAIRSQMKYRLSEEMKRLLLASLDELYFKAMASLSAEERAVHARLSPLE